MAQHTNRLNIGAAQVAASALAAASSAVAASTLGVAGTVIGAAVGSVVATIGTAIYLHSLQRTRDRLRLSLETTALRARRTTTATQTAELPPAEPPREATRLRWQPVAAGAGAAFLIVIAGISGYELATGRAVADQVNGTSGTRRTTIGGLIGGQPAQGTPATDPGPTATPSPSAAPTDAPPTPEPSPSSTAPPTSDPTGSPQPTAPPSEPAGEPTTPSP